MPTQESPITTLHTTRGTVTVAMKGQLASFHDLAAAKYFGKGYRPMGCDSFAEVFTAVEEGQADYGMIAVENSIYGPIIEARQLLAQKPVEVIGEVQLPIHHCLIGLPATDLAHITDVFADPIAIPQCRTFLQRLPGVQTHSAHDGAGSLSAIKKQNRRSAAVIAAAAAAELYGCVILAHNIEDDPTNCTRFVIFKHA